MSASALTPFDIAGELPTGTVLLEASAGTGKTWTIGALVARHVAEGVVRLEDMLVITFSRAASRELRERVREHLRHVHRLVADPQLPTDDEVVALLRQGSADEVAERLRTGRTSRLLPQARRRDRPRRHRQPACRARARLPRGTLRRRPEPGLRPARA